MQISSIGYSCNFHDILLMNVPAVNYSKKIYFEERTFANMLKIPGKRLFYLFGPPLLVAYRIEENMPV